MQIPLGDADGKGQPTFTATDICFNGRVDSGRLTSTQSVRGSHEATDGARGIATASEAFALTGGWEDGKSGDWDDARNACQQILGHGID